MNAIVKANEVNLDELQRLAKLLAASGYFDAKGDTQMAVAQMATKILAGRELGYGPFASVQGIHVVQGKPVLSANLMAAAVKGHPRYDYRVRSMTDKEVSIEFLEDKQSIGISTFTEKDAIAGGLTSKGVWKQFPRNMLFARAMSNGVRWYCPDVFSGSTVYVPEELGGEMDGNGIMVIDSSTGEIIEQPPQPNGNGKHEESEPDFYAEPVQSVQITQHPDTLQLEVAQRKERDEQSANDRCPECKAPAGKPHGTKCSKRNQPAPAGDLIPA